MPARQDIPSTSYLKLRNRAWYFKIAIPAALRHRYLTAAGKQRTHVEEALGTREHPLAIKRRNGRLFKWQTQFDHELEELRAAEGDVMAATRADLRKNADDPDAWLPYSDHVDRIAEKEGSDAALRFARLANAKLTFSEAVREWATVNEHGAATRIKDGQAVKSLLAWLKAPDVPVEDVTPTVVRRYIQHLNTEALSAHGGPLSLATKRARVAPLVTLWQHLVNTEVVPVSPWSGHPRLTGKVKAGNRAAQAAQKRPYADDELLTLANGPEWRETAATRYPKRLLMTVTSLLLLTGMRLGELMDLTRGDVEKTRSGYILHIRSGKTAASLRSIPVVHPLAVSLFKERMRTRATASDPLWPEAEPGGPTGTRAHHLVKALGYYRDVVGLPSVVDTHSTRRWFITTMVAKGAPMIPLQHYDGHTASGMTGVYAKATPESLMGIAKMVSLPAKVERALSRSAGRV